jgi:hypothetical protein
MGYQVSGEEKHTKLEGGNLSNKNQLQEALVTEDGQYSKPKESASENKIMNKLKVTLTSWLTQQLCDTAEGYSIAYNHGFGVEGGI